MVKKINFKSLFYLKRKKGGLDQIATIILFLAIIGVFIFTVVIPYVVKPVASTANSTGNTINDASNQIKTQIGVS